MTNIYNLQQVSLNSRIVAVEGTFDHIDANNINGAITSDSITVEEINAVDPVAGVSINDRLLVDEIAEKTNSNGVLIDSVLKVDIIEEALGLDSVAFPDGLKVDFIDNLISSTVQIDDINGDTIRKQGTFLKVEQPTALTLADEYGSHRFTFTNIDNSSFKEPTGIFTNNTGDVDYIPQNLSLFRFTVPNTGIYHIHINCCNNDVLGASGDNYAVRIITGAGVVLGSNSSEVGTQTGAETYDVTTHYCGLLNASDELRFEMRLVVGPTLNKAFDGNLMITRLK